MRSRMFPVALVLSAVGSSAPVSASAGFCMEPRSPHVFITKPTKPYCASTHSCSEYDITSYQNRVKAYYRDLQSYLDDVNRYTRSAGEYVECMADLD